MGIRPVLAAATTVLALVGCSGEEDPGLGPDPNVTTDADCAERIPDAVFTTLGWTATGKPAEVTVRGCHREAEQGYVEVRDRTGYDHLCKTLDRTGGVSPGVPADWLGTDVTACAVEPETEVGQTKVVVKRSGNAATQVTIAVLTTTPQERVRAAVRQLVG